jgi:hypothetical protein
MYSTPSYTESCTIVRNRTTYRPAPSPSPAGRPSAPLALSGQGRHATRSSAPRLARLRLLCRCAAVPAAHHGGSPCPRCTTASVPSCSQFWLVLFQRLAGLVCLRAQKSHAQHVHCESATSCAWERYFIGALTQWCPYAVGVSNGDGTGTRHTGIHLTIPTLCPTTGS